MKRYLRLVRNILFVVEEYERGFHPHSDEIKKSVAFESNEEKVAFNSELYKLYQEGYLQNMAIPNAEAAYDLTYKGHDLLDALRYEPIFNEVTSAIANAGLVSAPLWLVDDICSDLLRQKILNQIETSTRVGF